MRVLGCLLVMMAVSGGAACGGTIAITYSPGIPKRGVGPVRVDPFRYQPHHDEKGKLEANQIENTAIGSIYITQDVSGFVRDAVKMELHFMGYDYSELSFRAIRGNVKRFVADDLGYSIDWTLEAEFEVVTATGKTFSGPCRATTTTEKGPGFIQGATSEIVRKCIDQFVTAAQAQKAL